MSGGSLGPVGGELNYRAEIQFIALILEIGILARIRTRFRLNSSRVPVPRSSQSELESFEEPRGRGQSSDLSWGWWEADSAPAYGAS
jgi:hypothetical protein